ncbi:MAG: alginate lyase family protein [Vicinamibacterales bacterium]
MSSTHACVPRVVFSVLDSACRDLAVANDVVTGYFTIGGLTLPLGTEPDWRVDPFPDDKEWRVEWVKFYYGLDLAHAFADTKDVRYRDAWRRLVTSFVAQVPAGADDTEVAARRIQNWIYAWNRFEHEGGCDPLTEQEAHRVVGYLWDEVLSVRDNLTKERNHRTLELYALLVAALAFPDLDEGAALRDFAFEQLHLNLLADVRPDGVHREGSTHYHCIVLRSFLGAMQNARMAGIALPASFTERVALAADFALHCHRPDGRIPACSDADSESYADVLLLAGQLLNRADLVYAATSGAAGQAPSRQCASFPAGGYYTQRSGWGVDRPYADERFLIFDCGPLGDGGHGHYDQLSVEAASGGKPLLIDPGRYTYSETPPNWRRWFKSTAAHNTVLVDGLDQTPYARRKPGGLVASGQLLARGSAPRFDLVAGQCTSPAYEAVHSRAVLFVGNEYWLVADYLEGAREHTYELRWHLAPEAGQHIAVCQDRPGVIVADGVALTFTPAFPLRIEDGWFAPLYGVKHRAPVVAMSARATSTVLLTAVAPRDLFDTALRIRQLAGSARFEDPMVVEVRTPQTGDASRGDRVRPSEAFIDTLSWAGACHGIDLPGFSGTALAAWTRVDAGGRLVAFSALDVVEGVLTTGGRSTRMGNDSRCAWATWSVEDGALTTARSSS